MGVAAGNPATLVLYRAAVAMVVSYLVGKIVGSVAHRVIEDDVAAYKREHPIEKVSGAATEGAGDGDQAGTEPPAPQVMPARSAA